MAQKTDLFRQLQHLDESGSAERQAARLKRQKKSSGEILTTFLAYKLDHAADKMALGIAIGDPLTLQHEPDNQWDSNAVKVFWQEQWIGYLPKDMAALVSAEVPEAATGLDAVVTGLTTTSKRDAFRLQISIPIPKACRRLRELGVSSAFAWDFDRTTGPDKLRLVVNCTETAFRELQQLLGASYEVSKCGYSYYPGQDGRHYPWYLSLTDRSGQAPSNHSDVEQQIRSLFGVPSESTRSRKRLERLKDLEEQQELISQRLQVSRAEERRLRREFDSNNVSLKRRAERAFKRSDQAIELAEAVESELRQELDLQEKELELILAENKALDDQLAQSVSKLEASQLQLDYFQQICTSDSLESGAIYTPWNEASGGATPEIADRLLMSFKSLARMVRLKPSQCLELVSEELCPDRLLVLDSAWSSAEQAKGFENGDQLFEFLWLLATRFAELKEEGFPDRVAGQVFGSSYAPRESQTIERHKRAREERTFTYNGKVVEMWQHLKIGAKDSANRTLRIHFVWDSSLNQVVIGHCGKHLHNPNH